MNCAPGKKIYRHYFCAALCAFILCTMNFAAYAGGTEAGDLGTVAMGRGHAFVAKADNLSAFWYNPAGLSKSKGVNILLSGNIINQNVDFQRSGSGGFIRLDDNDDVSYGSACTDEDRAWGRCVFDPNLDYTGGNDTYGSEPPFSNSSLKENIGISPMLIINWGDAFNVEGLALALGVYAPPGYGTPSFSSSGAQRYSVRGANLIALFPGIGVSYAFNRYIQVGGVFASGFGFFEQNQAIRLFLNPNDDYGNEYAGSDADFKFDIKDNFIPTGIIGVMSNPLDWLELGVSVRLPMNISPEGKVIYTPPEDDMPESRISKGKDEIKMTQKYPWMLRSGVRYIHEYFDIEVDFIWEDWSSFKAEYEVDALVEDPAADPPDEYDFATKGEFVRNYRDSYSVRLGSDIVVWPGHIDIRVGGGYTSSAYPDNYETMAIDTPYGHQFSASGGITWHAMKQLDVNVGYMHIFQPRIKVTEGIAQQMGPATEMPTPEGETVELDLGNIVNNGSYDVSLNMFGASFEGHF